MTYADLVDRARYAARFAVNHELLTDLADALEAAQARASTAEARIRELLEDEEALTSCCHWCGSAQSDPHDEGCVLVRALASDAGTAGVPT